jgi:hypothetical protein
MMANRDYTTLKHHAKVHTFRLSTVLVAWALLVAGFVFYPHLIAQALRSFSHGVEHVADTLPERFGSYVEIGLRELGGLFWIQITALIVVVRMTFWAIARIWRVTRR